MSGLCWQLVFESSLPMCSDLQVIATTARQRDMTLRVVSPEEAASMVIGYASWFGCVCLKGRTEWRTDINW